MRKTRIMLIGLAGFFAAGAVLGALYAPDKGERTRRRIARKGRWFMHSANDAIVEGKDNIGKIKDRVKDNLEQLRDDIECLPRSS